MAESLRVPITIGAAGFVAFGFHLLLLQVASGDYLVGVLGVPVWVIGDVLVSLALGMFAGLVMASHRSGVAAAWRAAWQALAASVVVTALLFVGSVGFLSTIGHRDRGICDGHAPAWVEVDGGCYDVPRLWDYLWPPDRWFAPSRCIGMCG